jgi:hypothetical protein
MIPVSPNTGGKISNKSTQKKFNDTKEGVIVNSFIRDENSNCCNNGIIIPQEVQIPQDLFVKQDKISKGFFNHPLLMTVLAPIATLAIIAGFSILTKKTLVNKMNNLGEKIQKTQETPNIGRNINLTTELAFNIYNYFYNPTLKNLLIGACVVGVSSVGFVMKNIVDGIKDIWVKKRESDIKRDLEESLIEIETRSFSGKNQIVRNLLAQKAKEIKEIKSQVSFEGFNSKVFEKFKPAQSLSFSQNSNKKEQKFYDKTGFYALVGLGTLVLSGLLGRVIFKNIKTIAQTIEKITGKITPETRESIYTIIQNSGKPGKIGINTFVSEHTAFIYMFLSNPTAQTGGILAGIYTLAALGYVGSKTVEAVKDVQVKKANAETERQLQDRLVQVELKNFTAKKNSYIEPLMKELRQKTSKPTNEKEFDTMSENVLYEIKNSAPFVYS